MRWIKRALAGLAAGFSIIPASRAASTSAVLIDERARFQPGREAEREIDAQAFSMVRPELEALYSGPVSSVSAQMEVRLAGMGIRFQNRCLTGGAETEAFIQERMR